jgi:hypothetical protein
MAVKLVLLRTGETIISNVKEMVVGDENSGKVVGYYLENPCGIIIESLGDDEIDLSNNKTKMSIQLLNWIPLAKERKIPIISDWVVSIIDPIDDLRKTYEDANLVTGETNE